MYNTTISFFKNYNIRRIKMKKESRIFFIFFVVIYFIIFAKGIDLIFRNTLSLFTDLMALVSYFIAIITSLILADFTIKKIKKN